jgi:Tfp pilus tip-associated adhesin PilY1
MSAMVDYDLDGDMDVVLADANHSGDYYLIRNDLAGVYALNGEARSTDVAGGLDQRQYAVTRVRLTSIEQEVIGGSSQGLSVELYVSNNGSNWELYTTFLENDIRSETDLPWHTFNHYGSRLYWKALLAAEEDIMAEYTGASFETPAIYELSWEFVYVDRREYSRTSVVITNVEDSGNTRKFVIGGTFYFPGWQGHLRAYDVTDMVPETSSNSILRTVTRADSSAPDGRELVAAGVTVEWDAGELLNNRSAASRTIYTSVQSGAGAGTGLDRMDFTTSNVATLGPILQDVNNDNAGLIDFVRGEGRYWKLGDINHSNPTAVGPPDGDAGYMGSGYDTFKTTHENRRKMLYVGTNDGMLHCFDAFTGEEVWGYIPNNLLPKLKNMWAVDSVTGERYFQRDYYVDGTPVSADVYIDHDGDNSLEWITILVCGQGPGSGSRLGGGLNYYFALDITDPYDPQPLWEFNHGRLGETWSRPAFGRVTRGGVITWVAFTGSGYDNDFSLSIGDCFYSIDLEIGQPFWLFNAPDEDTVPLHGWNIRNTIPGSPSIIDVDQDGLIDFVYIGDLDGRIWKVDVTPNFRRTRNWEAEIIYEDAQNYPIYSRPTVWIDPTLPSGTPRLYFGTGGDDDAPNDTTYSFIALLDSNNPEVEWYLGDPVLLNLDPAQDMGDLGVGEKVWADPVIANSIVYFNTLTGSIESVDPCENLAGVGKLYGRYINSVAGSAIGGTAFRDSSGTLDSLDLESKTRSAVTLGETERVNGIRKREVYIQEYDSTIQKLEQPIGAILKIKSWREVYKVIR